MLNCKKLERNKRSIYTKRHETKNVHQRGFVIIENEEEKKRKITTKPKDTIKMFAY